MSLSLSDGNGSLKLGGPLAELEPQPVTILKGDTEAEAQLQGSPSSSIATPGPFGCPSLNWHLL